MTNFTFHTDAGSHQISFEHASLGQELLNEAPWPDRDYNNLEQLTGRQRELFSRYLGLSSREQRLIRTYIYSTLEDRDAKQPIGGSLTDDQRNGNGTIIFLSFAAAGNAPSKGEKTDMEDWPAVERILEIGAVAAVAVAFLTGVVTTALFIRRQHQRPRFPRR